MTTESPDTAAVSTEDRPAAVSDPTHGPHCLTQEQRRWLVGGINPDRVSQLKEGGSSGASYLQAYDVRAHLTRIFGFANWSEEQPCGRPTLVFEDHEGRTRTKKGEQEAYVAWTACYEATVRLTVNCPHGVPIGSYTESAAETGIPNQPQRSDAHHNGITAAVSTALKRAATNLGDQFGLSLYAKGRVKPIVGNTLAAPPSGQPEGQAPDAHITEQLPAETDASREPQRGEEPPAETTADEPPPVEAPRGPQQIRAEADRLVHEASPAEAKQRLLDLMTEVTGMRGQPGVAPVKARLIALLKQAEEALTAGDDAA